MANYTFSTITDAEALSLTANDILTIDSGSGLTSTVLYVPAAGGKPDMITLVEGARSVTFSSALAVATKTFLDGSSLYVGGAGNDTASLGATNDGLFGGLGNDTLNSGDGSNVLQGNQGDDVLVGGHGSDVIFGGADNDRIDLGASTSGGFANFAQGNKGDDTISGSPTDNDTILGGQGNDLIGATSAGPLDPNLGVALTPTGRSGGGADYLDGNLGNDTVVGGAGNETILGEDGNDLLFSNGGADTLDGGTGNDTIVGGNTGSAQISGGDGDDIIGFVGSTQLTASNTIDGGAGNDNISGSVGGDSISGGLGNDTIDGDTGADTVSGGAGADTFQFYENEPNFAAGRYDQISDWNGAEDHLAFFNDTPTGAGTSANYVELTASSASAALAAANAQIAGGIVNYVSVQVGSDVYVFADNNRDNGGADASVILVGKTLADISFSNFDGG